MTTNEIALGYHSFVNEEGDDYGSFELFFMSEHDLDVAGWNENYTDGEYTEGFYWWPCFPGCLPDSDEPSGPFKTAEEAYNDARNVY